MARRRRSVVELLRRIADETVTAYEGLERVEMTRRERLARVLWRLALEGNLAAARVVLEYSEGPPADRGRPPQDQPPTCADELAQATAGVAAHFVQRALPLPGEGPAPPAEGIPIPEGALAPEGVLAPQQPAPPGGNGRVAQPALPLPDP